MDVGVIEETVFSSDVSVERLSDAVRSDRTF